MGFNWTLACEARIERNRTLEQQDAHRHGGSLADQVRGLAKEIIEDRNAAIPMTADEWADTLAAIAEGVAAKDKTLIDAASTIAVLKDENRQLEAHVRALEEAISDYAKQSQDPTGPVPRLHAAKRRLYKLAKGGVDHEN